MTKDETIGAQEDGGGCRNRIVPRGDRIGGDLLQPPRPVPDDGDPCACHDHCSGVKHSDGCTAAPARPDRHIAWDLGGDGEPFVFGHVYAPGDIYLHRDRVDPERHADDLDVAAQYHFDEHGTLILDSFSIVNPDRCCHDPGDCQPDPACDTARDGACGGGGGDQLGDPGPERGRLAGDHRGRVEGEGTT